METEFDLKFSQIIYNVTKFGNQKILFGIDKKILHNLIYR